MTACAHVPLCTNNDKMMHSHSSAQVDVGSDASGRSDAVTLETIAKISG